MPSVRTYNLDTIDISGIRALLWETLSLKWVREGHYPVHSNYRVKYDDICISIAELAAKRNIIQNPPIPQIQPFTREISTLSKQRIGSVIWELVCQQILYIDLAQNNYSGNQGFTFDITEYGQKVLANGNPIPHDPEGYLDYLQHEIPDIDSVIYTYVAESIHAYNINLLLSATTAIGCASEKALLLLIEAYIPFLPTEKERVGFVQKTKGKFIKNQFEEFQKSLGGQKGRIHKELVDGIDIVISGIFELLRQNRNSAGHPTGKEMKKENVYASLQIFITYCKRIYSLMEFFKNNHFTIK
ncbi:hypothetical protein GC105_00800 [Alkalibaculum sp. M08DMB]|uniref:Abortive infection protein-like C-terminal domain-containing protein n=1 Tax=Alkalibaculum sporogenes TaxID=2655001 RepID=A0A6A7K4M8_9FIRM|nr:hypothetical protein [Alkalibaculum sporogenes]MPW24331.1 hypothetical protein [Alkalibaculum sporogenes]